LERVFIRPVANADELTVILLTVALLFIFNQGAGFIWGFMVKSFPEYVSPGNYTLAGLSIPWHLTISVGAILLIILGMHFLFRRTRLGLAMRVAAGNPDTSRLVGISPNSMRLIGWALAGAIGAIAGILASPIYFLSPSLMTTVLIYAFAAATLGGFDSPGGAIIGGLVMGIGENLAVTYISWLGSDLKVAVPLLTIIVVLMIRPTGLFGHAKIVRA
jgi:branched-chain amino acid transport system permease protein